MRVIINYSDERKLDRQLVDLPSRVVDEITRLWQETKSRKEILESESVTFNLY